MCQGKFWQGPYRFRKRSRTLRIYSFYLEYIQCIYIRAGKNGTAFLLSGYFTAITQYINIWKCYMHSHWAEIAALGVKIKAVAGLMASVAGGGAFAVY